MATWEAKMALTEWKIEGTQITNCSCAFGCPCQFNSLPTNGDCRAAVAVHIEKGHHGKVKLDGLNFAATVAWPGAIHMGKGECLPIVDERATEEQRAALLRIMSGEDTEPGATVFQVFATTYEKFHPPIFKRIDYKNDIESREAHFAVPGVVEVTTTPIRNPVTGEAHRVRVTLPHGFEYDTAEYASGTATAGAPVKLAFTNTHSHLAKLHMTGKGVVH
jgi:hypothetical protein